MGGRITNELLAAALKPGGERTYQSIADAFGPLRDWWIHPALRQAYSRPQPDLPNDPGTCVIVLARNGRFSQTMADCFLAEAMPLPLLWRETAGGHCDKLPLALRTLADSVIHDLRDVPEVAGKNWRLEFHPSLGGIDMGSLGCGPGLPLFGWESGWAALVGGLYLAAHGLGSKAKTWISAARDDKFGMRNVTCVGNKAAAAARWGVKDFYVRTNEEFADCGLDIHEIAFARDSGAVSILDKYFSSLAAPPVADDMALLSNYFRIADGPTAEEFYLNRVLRPLGAACHNQLAQIDGFRPVELVSFLSPKPSGVALGIMAAGAKFTTLLKDSSAKEKEATNLAKSCQNLKNGLQKIDPNLHLEDPIEVELGDQERERRRVREIIVDIRRRSPELGAIAFDLTPGYKRLSLHLQELARPGDWFLYCRHDIDSRGKIKVETSRYDVWRKE